MPFDIPRDNMGMVYGPEKEDKVKVFFIIRGSEWKEPIPIKEPIIDPDQPVKSRPKFIITLQALDVMRL